MTSSSTSRQLPWQIVVPVKDLDTAKTRLGFTTRIRGRLALAFACDTVVAALACTEVAGVTVVTDDDRAAAAMSRLGATVVNEQERRGLNSAIAEAVAVLPSGGPVGVLLADLPALIADELAVALRCAAGFRRAFVPDVSGRGTTLLTASDRQGLSARFGPDSAAAHESLGAVRLEAPGLERLRRDVDVESELWEAVALGVGRHSTALIEELAANELTGT